MMRLVAVAALVLPHGVEGAFKFGSQNFVGKCNPKFGEHHRLAIFQDMEIMKFRSDFSWTSRKSEVKGYEYEGGFFIDVAKQQYAIYSASTKRNGQQIQFKKECFTVKLTNTFDNVRKCIQQQEAIIDSFNDKMIVKGQNLFWVVTNRVANSKKKTARVNIWMMEERKETNKFVLKDVIQKQTKKHSLLFSKDSNTNPSSTPPDEVFQVPMEWGDCSEEAIRAEKVNRDTDSVKWQLPTFYLAAFPEQIMKCLGLDAFESPDPVTV